MDQLPRRDELLDEYSALLVVRPADVVLLEALDALNDYLTREGGEDTGLRERAAGLWAAKFDETVVAAGLRDPRTRWRALNLIRRRKLTGLLPAVREDFALRPDYAAVTVLSGLGGREDLELLLGSIPRFVDLDRRAAQPLSAGNVFGPECAGSFEYGAIVEALGRLATPEAIAALKRAAGDFDPAIRCAACKGLARLPLDQVDEEIAALIHARLGDPTPYVREAARQAQAALVV